MSNSTLDVIVVGAGHAGLSMGYFLKQQRLNYLIFERRKIGNSWRSQRWDTFKLNTANKVNVLPGMENPFADPDGFCSAPEFSIVLEEYVKKFELPVKENCKVLTIEMISDSKLFSVSVSENGMKKKYKTRQVVVASGAQNVKSIPAFAKKYFASYSSVAHKRISK